MNWLKLGQELHLRAGVGGGSPSLESQETPNRNMDCQEGWNLENLPRLIALSENSMQGLVLASGEDPPST